MKFIVFNEIRDFLFKNTAVFILSVLAFAFSCVAINLTLTYYLDAEEVQSGMEESYGDKCFYKIMINGDDVAFANFFSADNVEKRKNFFEEISSRSNFEYRYAVENSIEFFNEEDPDYSQDDFPAYKETCLYGYETGDSFVGEDYVCVKGIFADHLWGTESTLGLSKGSWFDDQDFYVADKDNIEIPVILGHEYSDIYKLGDQIENAHIGTIENTTLVVIGFLKENSYYYNNNNDKIILNRYMVVPAVEVTDSFPYRNEDGSYNNFFLNAYDSLKIMNARVICSNKEAENVKKEIHQICKENGLYEIRIYEETASAPRQLEDTREFVRSCLSISLFIILLNTVVYGIQLNYKLVKDRKKYSIFILNGITRKQLFFIAITDSFLVFIMADILFVLFWFYNFRNRGLGLSYYTLILIPILELFILIIMGLYGAVQTTRVNMSMILRENE